MVKVSRYDIIKLKEQMLPPPAVTLRFMIGEIDKQEVLMNELLVLLDLEERDVDQCR